MSTIATYLRADHDEHQAANIIMGLRMAAGDVDLLAMVTPVGRAKAWLDGVGFAMRHGTFPADQDFGPGERWRMFVLSVEDDTATIIGQLHSERREYDDPQHEVALLALPPGTGTEFVDAMRKALEEG